jgi:hypothetical protein
VRSFSPDGSSNGVKSRCNPPIFKSIRALIAHLAFAFGVALIVINRLAFVEAFHQDESYSNSEWHCAHR